MAHVCVLRWPTCARTWVCLPLRERMDVGLERERIGMAPLSKGVLNAFLRGQSARGSILVDLIPLKGSLPPRDLRSSVQSLRPTSSLIKA